MNHFSRDGISECYVFLIRMCRFPMKELCMHTFPVLGRRLGERAAFVVGNESSSQEKKKEKERKFTARIVLTAILINC